MKFTLNPVFSQAHGKLGKLSAYIGRIGLVLRISIKGTNPQTTYQQARRAQMLYYSKLWQTISESDIAAWNVAAGDYTYSDVLAEKYAPAGFNLFLKVNLQNHVYGQVGDITTVPTFALPTNNGPIADVFALARPTAVLMTCDIPLVSVGDVFQLWATPNFSAGVSYWKGRKRPIKLYTAGVAIIADNILPNYIARLGTPVAGKKMAINGSYYNTVGHGAVIDEAELSGKVK